MADIPVPSDAFPAIHPETGALVEIPASAVQQAIAEGFTAPSAEQALHWARGRHFGSGVQTALAALEGVGEGVLGPVIPGIERLAGVDPENILARKEANPGANMAGQAVGFVAPLVATLGASAPAQTAGLTAKVAAKTLPALATRAGAAVAERVAAPAGAGILRRAVPAAADFATQGAILGASNVATQAVLSDPKLSAESALAEVATSAGLGGLLGFGGSTAVHGVAAVLGKAGEVAQKVAARVGQGNTETLNLINRGTGELHATIHGLEAKGVLVKDLATARPETFKFLTANADAVAAIEAKHPGITADVLVRATPEEAARIVAAQDKIITSTQGRMDLGELVTEQVTDIYKATDDAVRKSWMTARAGEVDRLASLADPAKAQGQLGEVFDKATTLAGHMRAEPELYQAGAARRLELLAEGLARDSGGGSADTYRKLNQTKQLLDDIIPWGEELQNKSARDTAKALEGLRGDIKKGLESVEVWGEAGERQAAYNRAFAQFKSAEEQITKGPSFQKLMQAVKTPEGRKTYEANPRQINMWLNAMADARGGARTTNFNGYLDAAENLAGEMEKSGFGGAQELRAALQQTRMEFADTEAKAAVTQLVKQIQSTGGPLGSGAYIPTGRQLAQEVVIGGAKAIPVVGSMVTAGEATLTRIRSPSFTLGVIEAFGKASQRMSDSIGTGVGRLFAGTALKGASEGASALTSGNYTKVAGDIRAHAGDPIRLADHVERQTRGWSQHAPEAATEAHGVLARATQHLASKLPPEGSQGPFQGAYQPSPAELSAFNRAAAVAQNPTRVLDYISRGTVHPDHVEALSTIYPALHREISIQIIDGLAALTAKGESLPFKTRMGLALFLGGEMDPMLSPASMAANQVAFLTARQNEQTGNVEPSSRGLEGLGVAGRMSTPMQASASRSTT